MIVSARLLIEQSERNFSFWKLQNQFFLHMQLKTTSLLKGLPREKLEVNPFHGLGIHSPLSLRPQPWANENFEPKNKRGGSKRYFKSQAENYGLCLSICVSGCESVCAHTKADDAALPLRASDFPFSTKSEGSSHSPTPLSVKCQQAIYVPVS